MPILNREKKHVVIGKFFDRAADAVVSAQEQNKKFGAEHFVVICVSKKKRSFMVVSKSQLEKRG